MINISQCKRNSFKGCFYNSGGSGNFKGEVLRIEDNKYLFKDIYVSYTTYGGVIEVGKENHVWIMDAEIFKENGIKVGDCVAFAGEIYPYKRKVIKNLLPIIADCDQVLLAHDGFMNPFCAALGIFLKRRKLDYSVIGAGFVPVEGKLKWFYQRVFSSFFDSIFGNYAYLWEKHNY